MTIVSQYSDTQNSPSDTVDFSFNSVGSNFALCMLVNYNSGTTPEYNDSEGNTWTRILSGDAGSGSSDRDWHLMATDFDGGTSSTHTCNFYENGSGTPTAGTQYPAGTIDLYSGVDLTAGSPWYEDSDQAGGADSTAEMTTGVTPAANGALVVMGTCTGHTSGVSVSSWTESMTEVGDQPYSGGNHVGHAWARKIQATAAAINPVATFSADPGDWGCVLAAFPAAAGAAVSPLIISRYLKHDFRSLLAR